MSDDITSLIGELRGESTPQEEAFELEGKEFDPILKIASVLSRVKLRSCLRYYQDDHFSISMERGPRGRDVGRRRRRSSESFDIREYTRKLYDASLFMLLEHLGSGIDVAQDRYYFMRILQTSDEGNVVERMSLLRAWHGLVYNYNEDIHKTPFMQLVKKDKEEIAHALAMQYYEKKVVRLYHRRYGLPTGPITPEKEYKARDAPEDYQLPDKSLSPLDPTSIMAANELYPYLKGFEDRIKSMKSAFQFMLLISGRVYQRMIRNEELSANVDSLLKGGTDLHSAFDRIICNYHLDLMERKE